VRKDIEAVFEPAMEETRREVSSMLIRLSSRVKNMKMADFLRECGGDVDALIAKEKRQQKVARTAARGPAGGIGGVVSASSLLSSVAAAWGAGPLGGASAAAGAARAGMTVAKGFARISRVPGAGLAAVGGADADGAASSAPAAPAGPSEMASAAVPAAAAAAGLPMQTPGHGGPRSRIGGAGDLPPAKTPAMALMKSSTLLPFGGGAGAGAGAGPARTPSVSHFLPKTPGPAGAGEAQKRARVKRRNEMVYHVAVSENGSPILEAAAG
jgi:hypothetical protein